MAAQFRSYVKICAGGFDQCSFGAWMGPLCPEHHLSIRNLSGIYPESIRETSRGKRARGAKGRPKT